MRVACPSLMGRIFGHKYVKTSWRGVQWTMSPATCFRCGQS